MKFRNLIVLNAETWVRLKTLAGSELCSPRNYLRLLVRREWETRQSTHAEMHPVIGFSPSIPGIYHIHQRK